MMLEKGNQQNLHHPYNCSVSSLVADQAIEVENHVLGFKSNDGSDNRIAARSDQDFPKRRGPPQKSKSESETVCPDSSFDSFSVVRTEQREQSSSQMASSPPCSHSSSTQLSNHKHLKPQKSSLQPSSTKRNTLSSDRAHPQHGPRQSSVVFGEVEIREFEPMLGDNPSCDGGPPLALSWKCVHHEVLPVDDYGETRDATNAKRTQRSGLTCLNRSERREILLELNYSTAEILKAEREVIQIQMARRRSRARIERATTFRGW